jgi:hypothetical protein
MPTFQLLKRHSAATVENALAELNRVGVCDLRLPTHLTQSQFGGMASVIQLMITWAHRNPTSRILSYIPDGEGRNAAVKDFVTQDHGLAACLLDRTILSIGGHDITGAARRAALERMSELHDVPTATRGQKLLLACKDYANLDLPATLYDPGQTLRSPKGYEQLTREVMQRIVRGESTIKEPGHRTLEYLSTVIREIFKNTDNWGRRNVREEPVKPSVRGVRIEQYSHAKNIHLRMSADDEQLTRYLKSMPSAGRGDRQRIMEVSIFDSGPGVPARFLFKEFGYSFRDWPRADTEISPSDEYQTLRQCLAAHKSTGEAHRGDGLHAMMYMLSALEGFLRIRTGRLLLYRDFTTMRYPPVPTSDKEPELYDYHMSGGFMTPRVPVTGSLLTMIFPIPHATPR